MPATTYPSTNRRQTLQRGNALALTAGMDAHILADIARELHNQRLFTACERMAIRAIAKFASNGDISEIANLCGDINRPDLAY